MALEKSRPTIWARGILSWRASARSPLPVARSSTQAGFHSATISAARLRQKKSRPKLKRWFARSYRLATRSNISRTTSGSRERAVSSGELNYRRSLGTRHCASNDAALVDGRRAFRPSARNRKQDDQKSNRSDMQQQPANRKTYMLEVVGPAAEDINQ